MSQLTGNGTYSYAYDANGNIIRKTAGNVQIKHTYNSFDQLTRVDKYVGGAYTNLGRYYYDANGARAKTDESGTSVIAGVK
jgi:YD repeat-containing protein